jgi:hypothetical protein
MGTTKRKAPVKTIELDTRILARTMLEQFSENLPKGKVAQGWVDLLASVVLHMSRSGFPSEVFRACVAQGMEQAARLGPMPKGPVRGSAEIRDGKAK